MNSQISMFDTFDWKREVQSMLNELVKELELPEGSLLLLATMGRIAEKETSYSVVIYEPEWPPVPNASNDETRNSIVLRIEEKHLKKEEKDVLEMIVSKAQYHLLNKPTVISVNERKSEPDYIRLRFDIDSPELIDYIKENTTYRVKNYSSKEASFGCCSRFIECSDAKKCVHPNRLYSMACYYRHNLDNGKIFYGKNKNVDEHGDLLV